MDLSGRDVARADCWDEFHDQLGCLARHFTLAEVLRGFDRRRRPGAPAA
jgi:hypothetical protein